MLRQAVEDSTITSNQFKYWKNKLKIQCPDYEIIKRCENPACGKLFTTTKNACHTKFCDSCGSPSQRATTARWRKRNGNVRHVRKSQKIRSQTNYAEMSSGWTYNEQVTDKYDSVCQYCHKENKDLNRLGMCEVCYLWRSTELADPNNPHFMTGRYQDEPLSEWETTQTGGV